MFDNFLIDSILMLFPLAIYVFYIAANFSINKKKNNIFYELSLAMSFFLLLKLGINETLVLALINIPIFLALRKKYYLLTVAFIMIYILYNSTFMLNILIIFISYLIILLFNLFVKNKRLNIILFSLLNTITIFIISHSLIISLMFLTLFMITVFLCKKSNNILNFNIQYKELEKEKKIKTSLFKITHEIKNPIAVCKAYLDMFNIDDKNQSKKYLKILKNEIARLLCLLEDFSLVNKLNINCDIMDISLLLEDNVDGIKHMLKNKNININFDNVDDEVYIIGDYNRLSQVIINLMKNSMEADPKNININLNVSNNKAIINIKDDGIGIEKSILEKIKEPFYTTKINGTGLGVSLSNEIVEAHHGKLTYKSEYGKGTNVQIILPVYNI